MTIVQSPVGMPGRALRSPLIERVEYGVQPRPNRCIRCLPPAANLPSPLLHFPALIRRWRATGKTACSSAAQGNWSRDLYVQEQMDQLMNEWRSLMKLGFLYAGQGSQHPGMGADLYEAYPAFRDVLDNAHIDMDLKEISFTDPNGRLNDTRYTQPCMVAFAAGVTAVLRDKGVTPSAAAGLSLGEYSALPRRCV